MNQIYYNIKNIHANSTQFYELKIDWCCELTKAGKLGGKDCFCIVTVGVRKKLPKLITELDPNLN